VANQTRPYKIRHLTSKKKSQTARGDKIKLFFFFFFFLLLAHSSRPSSVGRPNRLTGRKLGGENREFVADARRLRKKGYPDVNNLGKVVVCASFTMHSSLRKVLYQK
jgi:hypothetical protein